MKKILIIILLLILLCGCTSSEKNIYLDYINELKEVKTSSKSYPSIKS